MYLSNKAVKNTESYQFPLSGSYPQSMELLSSLPHNLTQLQLSNSTSWSGSIVQNDLLQPVPDDEPIRQTRRSWARSKRISLGCLEWRANPNGSKRALRPKSAHHQLDGQLIEEYVSDGGQSESGSTVLERAPSITSTTNTEQSKPGRFGRSKAYVGADALLRRLRMRPLTKNGRAKMPTQTSIEAGECVSTIPVRSASAPRTSCMSKSFVDCKPNELCVFPNCSHGSRINMATVESGFSVKSAPQRTESYPAVGPCLNPAHCSCTNNLPAPMTRSFMQSTSGRPDDFRYKQSSCSCALECNGTGGFVITRHELYRPLSQPSCCIFDGSSIGPSTELVERGHFVPPMRYSTLPWTPTSSLTVGQSEDSSRAIHYHQSSSDTQSSLLTGHSPQDPAYLARYWSHGPNQMYPAGALRSTAISAANPSRHGPFAFPSSKTADALFVSCSDAQRPYVSPHMIVSNVPLKANKNETVQLQNNNIYSARGRSMEQRHDVCLSWMGMDATSTMVQTKTTTTPPHQTRPDSLLSASSLTTADSSQTDSLPNSSSSRDSALGGNAPSQHMGCSSFLGIKEFDSNVRMHSHHQHQQQNHHPQLHQHQQSVQDSRAWSAEDTNRNMKSAAQMEQNHQLHSPPISKPTALIEPRQPPPPSRSVAWPPRLTGLQDLGVSPAYRPSQKARADRKHSVYVNAAIYPLREQPQPTNGDRSGARGVTPSTTGTNGHCSPPALWTHLLPYRASTVPQNLSERLKKSETLPNDVWVQARRPECAKDQHNNHEPQAEQSSRHGGAYPIHEQTNNIPVGLKSPPPRPPVRTSSQQIVGRMASLESRRPPPKPPTPTSPTTEHGLFGMLTGDRTPEDSPILCRYSQLYSLAIKPDASSRLKLKSTSNLSTGDLGLRKPNTVINASPRETPTQADNLPPELQMQNLRIRVEDRE